MTNRRLIFCAGIALWTAFSAQAAPPANDLCSGAVIIPSVIYSNYQSTAGATSNGDPTPPCVYDFANGVWYQYTPTIDGQLDVDTAGSSFDTGLGIYTGTCGDLAEVACNDDNLETGSTAASLSLLVNSNVTYYILAGGSGEATGNLVLQTVFTANGPPLIGTQPANQSVAVGSNATFTVTASSLSPLSYFWKRNGAFIPGANGSSYTLLDAQTSDSGSQFSCLVSNSAGTALSSNATLSVSAPTTLYHFDFESGLQGFTIDNTFGDGRGFWHLSTGRGNQAGHSPTHSLYYGTNEGPNGGGNYDSGNSANGGVVISPPLQLSGAPVTLTFTYLMAVEPYSSTYNPDQAYIEASTNGGASYAVVESKGFGMTNNTGGQWVTNQADLSPFVGSNVRLRFRFDTLDNINNDTEGWYVDDITITGLALPAPILQNVTANNGMIQFSWNAQTGQGYQTQYTTNLNQTNWINLGAGVTNPTLPVSYPIGADPQRFYRLREITPP